MIHRKSIADVQLLEFCLTLSNPVVNTGPCTSCKSKQRTWSVTYDELTPLFTLPATRKGSALNTVTGTALASLALDEGLDGSYTMAVL